MANSFIHPNKGSGTETVTANAAGATDTLYVKGPPVSTVKYGPSSAGRYVRQLGGANGVWRWVEDYPLPAGTATPTGYTADNL